MVGHSEEPALLTCSRRGKQADRSPPSLHSDLQLW